MLSKVILLAILAVATCLTGVSAGPVIELTADNFDSYTSEGNWLIEFYAPWCVHCQRMAPHLDAASKKLTGSGVNIGKVDGPAWRSLTFRFGVGGYPSFFHIKGSDTESGREIRKIGVESSVAGVQDAALEGWKSLPALPWASGPFGFFALAKFYGLKYGEKVFKLHEPLAYALDIPPMFTGFAFGLVLLAGSVGLLIGFAVWLGPKKRRGEEHDE